jgi:hypothetical protein
MPRFFTVADDRWQDWILRNISSAPAVIVDYTVTSTGLEWELQAAATVLSRERIIILHRRGENTDVPTEFPSIIYSVEKKEDALGSLEQTQQELVQLVARACGLSVASALPFLSRLQRSGPP